MGVEAIFSHVFLVGWWLIIGIIGIYLSGLRTGRAIKLHKKGRDFRVPEKKRKEKEKTDGSVTFFKWRQNSAATLKSGGLQ